MVLTFLRPTFSCIFFPLRAVSVFQNKCSVFQNKRSPKYIFQILFYYFAQQQNKRKKSGTEERKCRTYFLLTCGVVLYWTSLTYLSSRAKLVSSRSSNSERDGGGEREKYHQIWSGLLFLPSSSLTDALLVSHYTSTVSLIESLQQHSSILLR